MNSVLRIFLAFASMLIVPTTLAQSPAKLEVIVFPGGFNWPIWVAQEKRFFPELLKQAFSAPAEMKLKFKMQSMLQVLKPFQN